MRAPARVAVTGAGGTIGSRVVAALRADERVGEVVALDTRPGFGGVVRDVRDPEIRRDFEAADAVVHLAFRMSDVPDAESVNVQGSRNVFSAAVAAGVRRIVHASSASVYGAWPDNPVPLREDDRLRPLPGFAYPEAKLRVEAMLSELASRAPELSVAWLRPTRSLNPGAPLLLARRFYVSPLGHDPEMQFTWVDDVASAFAAAVFALDATGPFNVGAPGTVRASEVARVLGVRSLRMPYGLRKAIAAAGTRLRVPGALHPGVADMARYPIVVSAERAERELGWRAEHESVDALRVYATQSTNLA